MFVLSVPLWRPEVCSKACLKCSSGMWDASALAQKSPKKAQRGVVLSSAESNNHMAASSRMNYGMNHEW